MAVSLLPTLIGSAIYFSISFLFPVVKTMKLLDGSSKMQSSLSNGDTGGKDSSASGTTVSAISEKSSSDKQPQAVETTSKSQDESVEYIHWLMYWLIFCAYSAIETDALTAYIPFYIELKCILFAWLSDEKYKGAACLWYIFLKKHYASIEPKIVNFYNDKLPFLSKHIKIE